jgi:formate dehydrogenase maturation protein FdhE
MTYACPAWEFAADNHLLKLQRPQNKVLCTIGNFPRRTRICDLHMAFKLLDIYDYITKLCRQQAEVIQNHENANVHNTGNIRGLNLVAVKHTTVQVTRLLL